MSEKNNNQPTQTPDSQPKSYTDHPGNFSRGEIAKPNHPNYPLPVQPSSPNEPKKDK